MANTVIQFKQSFINAAPISLNVGEPAYSFVSNTLFIGTPGNNGFVKIGGLSEVLRLDEAFHAANSGFIKTNSAFSHANSAFANANGAFAAANGAYIQANAAFIHANSGYQSQNATGQYANAAFIIANGSYHHANAAFANANGAFAAANGAYLQANAVFSNANSYITNNEGVNVRQNNNIIVALNSANAAHSNANGAFAAANAAYLQANSGFIKTNSAFGHANAAYQSQNATGQYANSAFIHANSSYRSQNATGQYANAAFTRANNSLSANVGGTVTGDVTITGNLFVTGNTTYVNTSQVLIADNIITLNAALDQASAPTLDAGIEIDRGSSANVFVLWNETIDKWTITNDGTNYYGIGSDAAETYANSAFIQANASFDHANAAYISQNATGQYANSAFVHANSAYNSQNATGQYANSAFIHANSGFIQANSAFGHANAAYTSQNATGQYANSAFIHANSAYNSQNATGQYANSAFIHANSGFIQANSAYNSQNATGQYANSAFIQANSAYNSQNATGQYANAAFIRANNSLNANVGGNVTGEVIIVGNLTSNTLTTTGSNGSISGANAIFTNYIFAANGTVDLFIYSSNAYANANAAFAAANAAFANANGAFAKSNAAFANANGAFASANAAYIQANSGFIQTNAAFIHANSGFIQANSAYNSQNATGNVANSGFIQSNAAFGHANAAYASQNATGQYANSAFIHANSAFIQTNSAFGHANAAYISQNATGQYANSAFVRANNSLDANNGGSVTGFVNVTQNVSIGTYLDLATDQSNPTRVEGRIFYDNTQHALAYYNESDMTFQIGQESVLRVWNNTGTTIDDGKPVYITNDSSANGFPSVALASAASSNASEVIGITTTSIANSGYGYVTTVGKVNGLNTSLFTEGQELFLSDTPGQYQTSAAASPSVPLVVGYVVVSDVTNGSIYVHTHLMEGRNKSNGAILFARDGVIDQDPTTLYWDYANNSLGVGTATPQANLHVTGSGLFTGNVTISGNLNVTNANFISTSELTVTGNTIVMNNGATGTPTLNAEIIINRGSSPNVFIRWDESIDEWTLSEDGTTNYHILTSGKTADTWDVYNSFDAYEKRSYPIGANLAKGTDYQANAAFATANIAEIIAISGFIQANSGFIHANAAYLSQNATGQYANSAFIQANSAYNSQNATGQYANSAFIQANSAYNSQNATGQYANSAFIHANSAYNSQNATGQYANSAFIQANSSYQSQNATGQYANSAFFQANAAFDHANAAFISANNVAPQVQPAFNTANAAFIQANAGILHAQSAFIQANAGILHAQTAFNQANAAFIQANAGILHAQSAFIRANNSLDANNGGSVSGTILSTANVRADYVVANTGFTSAAGLSRLQLTDIGLAAIQVAGQEFKFGAAGIESSPGIFGGSFGGNKLSLNNETNLRSERYDVVKIQTGTDGTTPNEWVFSNNSLTAPGGITANGFTAGGINVVPTLASSYDIANASFVAANSAGVYANGAFVAANSAGVYANAAFAAANAAGSLPFVQTTANTANAAFIRANNSLNANVGGTITGNVVVIGNVVADAFQTSGPAGDITGANAIFANYIFGANGSLDLLRHTNSAFAIANAAFIRANNSLNANVGGLITGDVSITGNLIVTGNTVYANTQTLLIADNILTLNAALGQASSPTMDAGIEVDRGNQPNVSIIWNETTDKWTFTNDGSTYSDLGSGSGSAGDYANGAFIQANAAFAVANAANAAAANGGSVVVTFATEPPVTGNANGHIWIDSNDGTEYTYFKDSDGFQWVEFGPTSSNVTTNTFITANITSSFSQANAAFNMANAASQHANAGFEIANNAASLANSGFAVANGAASLANSAFDLANGTSVSANSSTVTSSRLSSNLKINIVQVLESANIYTTAIGGNVNIDIGNNTSYFFSSNTTANVTFNLRGNATTTFDTTVAIGQTASVAIALKQGATKYKANVYIDGVLQTPYWLGNSSPGYATTQQQSIDVYTYTVFKTAASTYSILAANSNFGLAQGQPGQG